MATILSKSPPTYNANNVQGSVKQITDYLRYLHENVDFLLGQLKKKDTDTYDTLAKIQETLSSIKSSISTIEAEYTALEARVSALEKVK
ncbi:MAG: hypothetical protein RR365_04035 [Bacteroides sp.]